MSTEIKTKICTKCLQTKSLECFSKNQYWCKSCCAEYRKAYYQTNAEKLREYGRNHNKQYRIDNADRISEKHRIYRENSKSNCIYFIKEHSNIVYTGSSQNIKYRVYNHLNLNSNLKSYIKENRWTNIEYIDIDDIFPNQTFSREDLYFIEHIIIRELNPSLNKHYNYSIDDVIREFELTEIAYSILEHLEDYTITYKTNHSYDELQGLDNWLEGNFTEMECV